MFVLNVAAAHQAVHTYEPVWIGVSRRGKMSVLTNVRTTSNEVDTSVRSLIPLVCLSDHMCVSMIVGSEEAFSIYKWSERVDSVAVCGLA